MSTTSRSGKALWALTAVVLLGLVLSAFVPGVKLPLIVVQVGFALVHGARRYGWRAVGVFVAAGLVISNILENLSIGTGFPFGHYHYTGGGKIFQVPWFIGPAYLATGYLAWIVATVLLGDVRRGTPWLTTIGTPVIGAFAMTAWDLALDPATSTIRQTWIWENGGGFFGVPLVNFLGWTFTVYLFMQVFALYLRRRGRIRPAPPAVTCKQYCLTRQRRSRSSPSSSPARTPPSPTPPARPGTPGTSTKHRHCSPSTGCSSSHCWPCCASPSATTTNQPDPRKRSDP